MAEPQSSHLVPREFLSQDHCTLLPRAHYRSWYTDAQIYLFIELKGLNCGYNSKRRSWLRNTEVFFLKLLPLRKKNCIWSHMLIFLKSWKFNSFFESCKERGGDKVFEPEVIVLLYCYPCHGANIHNFPLGMKLKCQIFMIMTWLQSKDRKKHNAGRRLHTFPPSKDNQSAFGFGFWFCFYFLSIF